MTTPEAAVGRALEDLLIAEGVVSEAQVERARRIAERLEEPRRAADLLVEMGQLSRSDFERVQALHRSTLSLVEILHEDGALDDAGVAAFLRAKDDNPGFDDRALLVDGGLVSEDRYLHALSSRHGIPLVEPEPSLVDISLLQKASLPYLIRHRVLPMGIAEGELMVVMADPLDTDTLAELERIYRQPVRPFCATEARVLDALHTLERVREGKPSDASAALQYREVREIDSGDVAGEGAVAIVDYLLLRAIQMRASDLHIEPQEDKVRVRVRVDGVLQQLTSLPASVAPSVVSRLKVLAGADIAERRLHQDGRINVVVDGREVDIRVSTYVSVHGETLVMRLLDRRRGLVPLDDLGFESRVGAALRDVALRTSSGLVLVTGPTGSGKTTTLYSFVDYINDPSIKVISCEDPVEYVLGGVTQCSVNQKVGPTFADSLRAIVRQDPDVVVVGEVRDPTTANLAVEAALTGHKVFSTFHTEDAVGAVVRLAEMDVEAFLVASTLSCVVAQRLVRKVCDKCRAAAEPSREDLRFLGLERADLDGLGFVAGTGCAACDNTGFKGRVGIHEVLLPDDDFKDAIVRRVPSKELRRLARALPVFLTLQEAGLLKAAAGATTLGEVVANAPRDTSARKPAVLREIAGDGSIL